MEQLILRQAAIDALDDAEDAFGYLTRDWREVLNELPPAQPDPHIGRWVPVGVAEVVGGESAMWGSAIAYHKCSECNGEALEEGGKEKLSDFCPNCGAKMEVNHESN